MGQFARALGVPAQNIFCDTLVRHSTENGYYSYLLAKELGFMPLALPTDPFLSTMLKAFTRKRFAKAIQHIMVVFERLNDLNSSNLLIDPTAAFRPGFQSILKTESLSGRIRGAMGR